jgi:hypothetical protein
MDIGFILNICNNTVDTVLPYRERLIGITDHIISDFTFSNNQEEMPNVENMCTVLAVDNHL